MSETPKFNPGDKYLDSQTGVNPGVVLSEGHKPKGDGFVYLLRAHNGLIYAQNEAWMQPFSRFSDQEVELIIKGRNAGETT